MKRSDCTGGSYALNSFSSTCCWAWGLINQVAGGMIHLVLVAAAVELIKILLSGRQSML